MFPGGEFGIWYHSGGIFENEKCNKGTSSQIVFKKIRNRATQAIYIWHQNGTSVNDLVSF